MGKVIQMSDYRLPTELKRLEKDFNPPDVYNIRLEFIPAADPEGDNTLMYDISNKKMAGTLKGKELVIQHLLLVLIDLCENSDYSMDAILDALEDEWYGE